MRKKPTKYVEVQIMSDPTDLSQVGVMFTSSDGSDLTGQELLDAFSDALIVDANVGYGGIEPEPSYDS